MKKILCLIFITSVLTTTCSCTLLKDPLDERTGFSNHLKQTENFIRNENWEGARTSLEETRKVWKKLKPMLQVDIDHDYVNDIENNFTRLDGYIDTKEKPDSLAAILLIKETWKDIGSL